MSHVLLRAASTACAALCPSRVADRWRWMPQLVPSAQFDGRRFDDSSADFDLLTEVPHMRVDERAPALHDFEVTAEHGGEAHRRGTGRLVFTDAELGSEHARADPGVGLVDPSPDVVHARPVRGR